MSEVKELKEFPGYFITETGKVYTNLRKVTLKGVYPCPIYYEPDYTRPPRELKLSENKGYKMVSIQSKYRSVHRLVAETYIENPNNLPEVNHINKNKSDNRVENLEWCDRWHQMEHASSITVQVECIKTGKVFDVYNFRKWCRDNNFDHSAMFKTKTGERKQHKGHRLL